METKDLGTRVEELERRMDKADADHKEFFDRLRALESMQSVIKTHYEHLEESLNKLETNIELIKTELCEIREKPAQRWDAVTMAAIGALVGFMLSQIGIS